MSPHIHPPFVRLEHRNTEQRLTWSPPPMKCKGCRGEIARGAVYAVHVYHRECGQREERRERWHLECERARVMHTAIAPLATPCDPC